MSPFNQHIVRDTQRRRQLCECRMISWKPLMVENVFFSYSSICQQPSTLSLMVFFWIDFQQTRASLALLCHGYHPISPTKHSQCLFLGSIPIRPTSAMVFRKVLYSARALFSDYSSPVSSLIRSFEINAHCYVDDTQLYVPFTPGIDEEEVRNKLEDCIDALRVWMNKNRLKLNDKKLSSSYLAPLLD